MQNLTDDDISIITDALRVAANHYRDNAATCRETGHVALAEIFVKQAKDAMALADRVGGA